MERKKILIVTRNLPPLIGGMERLNWHIADELSHDHEVVLLSHQDAKEKAPKNCQFFGVKLNPLPSFLILAFVKTFFICLRFKPDILFAGSGLTAPIVVFWAKLFRKKSVVYIHGLDINNSSYIYQLCWLPFIRTSNAIIANSTPTKKLAIQHKIEESKISIIHPGVSYPPPARNPEIIDSLVNQFNLKNKKILLSIGRLTERKGILEFIEKCLPNIVQNTPNSILVIVGSTANDALNNKFQTKDQILNAAEKNNVTEHIIFTGSVSDEQLSQLYYLADVHIFPVKHIPDDPEGFGMVAIEAAAHGTPTVAFKTGGIVDAVKENVSGHLVQPNEYRELTKQILSILRKPKNTVECQKFAEKFSWINLRLSLRLKII